MPFSDSIAKKQLQNNRWHDCKCKHINAQLLAMYWLCKGVEVEAAGEGEVNRFHKFKKCVPHDFQLRSRHVLQRRINIRI